MRKYFLAIVTILSINFSFACGNEYYYRTDLPLDSGKLNFYYLINQDEGGALPYWSNGFGEGSIKVNPQSLLDSYNKTKDYKFLSNYAWELVKDGKAKEAIIILDSLLKTHPTEYNILANLGTAYELVGENIKALDFLTKAVAINKNSHHGSEWIHLNILKYKINKEAFPIEKIIDLRINDNNSQWNTDKWTYPIPADSLLKSIAYQLHERIGFIKPTDKVIGRLVFDFAEIIAKTKSKEEALPFYDYALFYDKELNNEIANAKLAKLVIRNNKDAIEESQSKNNKIQFILFASILSAAIAVIVGRKIYLKK